LGAEGLAVKSMLPYTALISLMYTELEFTNLASLSLLLGRGDALLLLELPPDPAAELPPADLLVVAEPSLFFEA
jgi:hypothetical protein